MENITQFVSYLDYGVLGLSAIILILSFVLLSREQKREVFRPEVEKAIRRYMMLALAFAAIGLVSTVLEGVFVKPAKAEQKEMQNQLDIISNMVAINMHKKMEGEDGSIVPDALVVEPLPESEDSADSTLVVPKGDSTLVNLPDSIVNYNNLKKSVFMSFYDFGANKAIFTEALNKLEKQHPEIKEDKKKIINDYDNLADMKIQWLEKEVIPAYDEATKGLSDKDKNDKQMIVELPKELLLEGRDKSGRAIVSDEKKMKAELEMLKKQRSTRNNK